MVKTISLVVISDSEHKPHKIIIDPAELHGQPIDQATKEVLTNRPLGEDFVMRLIIDGSPQKLRRIVIESFKVTDWLDADDKDTIWTVIDMAWRFCASSWDIISARRQRSR